MNAKPSQRTPSTANPDGLEAIVARAASLRAKYRRERDKRIQARPQGDLQFQELRGEFADFDRDPNADPGFSRSAVVEETDVAIIGAGFGGMMVAAHRTRPRSSSTVRCWVADSSSTLKRCSKPK